jgi:tryptophan halogenase
MALQENRNIRRIAIIGAGTSGYLTAFYLAKNFPDKHIRWVYPQENNPIGVGEALIPDVSQFLNDLGISHQDIIKHCNGTLKLGIKFDGFNTPNESFTFPFGVGQTDKYNAASLDRMMSINKVPDNIYDYKDISVHFRATELLNYLDTLTGQFKNLEIIRKNYSKTDIRDCDLIIDSTGFKKVLTNWENNFIDISDKVPNNTALVFRHSYTDKENQCVPYSIFKAAEFGWIWNIPLGDELAVGYVHNNKYNVKQEFVQYIKQKYNIIPDESKIMSVGMKTGRNIVHMKDNVVAIGLCSAFIEPIESTGLYLTTSALKRLHLYITNELSEDEYNLQTNEEFDSVMNFIIAHYKYSNRVNEYWNHYKNIDVQDWKEIDIFPNEAWNYILSGFRDDVKRPSVKINPQELIDIQRGQTYYKWLENEKNST